MGNGILVLLENKASAENFNDVKAPHAKRAASACGRHAWFAPHLPFDFA
jgi:hypothetical protein